MAVGDEGAADTPRRGRRRKGDLPSELTDGIDRSVEVAINHRTRREILRVLADLNGGALSPSQLVHDRTVDATVAAVSYHAKMLVKHGAAVIEAEYLTGGSTQCFYRSTVATDRQFTRILRAMKQTDNSLATKPPAAQ